MISLEFAKITTDSNKIRQSVLAPYMYFLSEKLVAYLQANKQQAVDIAKEEMEKADAFASKRLNRHFKADDVELQKVGDLRSRIIFRLLNDAVAPGIGEYGPYDVYYWNVIDTGRGPGLKAPPSTHILNYLKKKGVNPNYNKVYGGLKNKDSQLRRYAYFIAKKIGKEGTKGRPEIFQGIRDRIYTRLSMLINDII